MLPLPADGSHEVGRPGSNRHEQGSRILQSDSTGSRPFLSAVPMPLQQEASMPGSVTVPTKSSWQRDVSPLLRHVGTVGARGESPVRLGARGESPLRYGVGSVNIPR